MTVDDRRLRELIVESEDLQVDAMRASASVLDDVRDFAHERRHERPDLAQLANFNRSRTLAAQRLRGETGFGTKLVAGGALTALAAAIIGGRAAADQALDVQMLQTASSLERLAVNTYEAALGLDFIKTGNATIKAFAETTMSQHDQHRQGFQAMTEAMGGTVQDSPNPVFQAVVEQAMPGLVDPLSVVMLAATLEKVATDTYLNDLTLFEDAGAKQLMGSVMGVEAQHLATLRAVQALLEGGGEALIAIPTDLAALPAAAGSVAFPEAFETYTDDMIAPPESGAAA